MRANKNHIHCLLVFLHVSETRGHWLQLAFEFQANVTFKLGSIVIRRYDDDGYFFVFM